MELVKGEDAFETRGVVQAHLRHRGIRPIWEIWV